MLTVDLGLIAGRRPELLSTTLASFAEQVFPVLNVRKVFANIDPFMGDEEDGQICRQIIESYFPHAQIRQPEVGSFGAAVKHTWQSMTDVPCLHLEDDWVALEKFSPESLGEILSPGTGMVLFSHRSRKEGEKSINYRVERRKILGITVRRRYFNGFGTSPGLLSADAARLFGDAMDPGKDPEKQVLTGSNTRLCELTEKFTTKKIWGENGGPLIRDIGRDYRAERNLRKVTMKDGSVKWVPETRPAKLKAR